MLKGRLSQGINKRLKGHEQPNTATSFNKIEKPAKKNMMMGKLSEKLNSKYIS
jgi:hypothetical protein